MEGTHTIPSARKQVTFVSSKGGKHHFFFAALPTQNLQFKLKPQTSLLRLLQVYRVMQSLAKMVAHAQMMEQPTLVRAPRRQQEQIVKHVGCVFAAFVLTEYEEMNS